MKGTQYLLQQNYAYCRPLNLLKCADNSINKNKVLKTPKIAKIYYLVWSSFIVVFVVILLAVVVFGVIIIVIATIKFKGG